MLRRSGMTVWVAACLAAAIAWCGPAEAIVIRDDVPDAVALTAAAGDHAVGKLLNRNRIDCTATLISPRWVLTAAHCLTDIRHPKLQFVGQRIAADRWYVHRSWNNNERQGFDIGLVRLSRPVVAITPATLYRQRDEVGQTARIVGFGDHGNGDTGATEFDALRRAGSNVIDRVENIRGRLPHVLITDFDRPDALDVLADEVTTASGDSGGPMLIGNAVAGITSWGSSDFSEYGDVARYTRVSSFFKWVDRVMGSRKRALRLAVEGRPNRPILLRSLHGRTRDASALISLHSAAVPEPGVAVVLLASASVMLVRRRRSARGYGTKVTPSPIKRQAR